MSIPRLLLRPPVIISTLAIMASLGVQGMLEGLVPLHLIDKLNRLNDNGISFVILGLAFTVLVPIVGKVNDTLISRWDERMRYCLMLFGSLAMILAMVLMALAKTYAVLMVGFAFFALTNLCMCIPAQSAYGDFINSVGTDSMARGYSIAICAWAAALVNRLIYTLTIASIPDLLQKTMGVSRASNGMVTAAFGVGGLVAGSLTGYISDRTQNRLIPQITASVLYVVSGLILFFATRFYQIVMFRLVLGVASSVADTMLFTTVADVYPANLLGFKMAVIFVFDNVGNMLGPLLGGQAYEHMGVNGIATIAMALGAFELIMVLVFVRNSLDIRRALADSQVTQAGVIADKVDSSTIVSSRSGLSAQPSAESDISIISKTELNDDLVESTHSKPQRMHLWRLMLQLQVVGPTVSIFVATGMQTIIETILPLRLFDKFGYSPATIGIAFLIVGGVLILAMPAVGFINDRVVSRHGEHMRYYTIAAGALCVFLSQIIMSLARSYAVLIFGYSVFAVSAMVVIVPAQSAFGDFINSSESSAMAQCYSLAWIAEGLANISLPPIASGMYATVGFLTMLMSMSAVLCTACALAVLAFPVRRIWLLRRAHQ
ncbi:hypothetical protein IWW51_000465 [Coemansia sp. RSA 2702]|nr:hypothetical protein IWW51_000465 [Coemansia sp. RSA 2702]